MHHGLKPPTGSPSATEIAGERSSGQRDIPGPPTNPIVPGPAHTQRQCRSGTWGARRNDRLVRPFALPSVPAQFRQQRSDDSPAERKTAIPQMACLTRVLC